MLLLLLQTLSGLVSLPLDSSNSSTPVSSALPLWGMKSSNSSDSSDVTVTIQMDSCTLVLPQADYAVLLALALMQQSYAPPGCVTPASLVPPSPQQALTLAAGVAGCAWELAITQRCWLCAVSHQCDCHAMCELDGTAAGIQVFQLGNPMPSDQQSIFLGLYQGCVTRLCSLLLALQ